MRNLTFPQAWSSIVYELIPNVKELEQNLRDFANIIEADEVLLFERATFLVISHYCIRQHRDVNRFEKVSNIIKQFKLSCRLVKLLSSLSTYAMPLLKKLSKDSAGLKPIEKGVNIFYLGMA